MWEVPIIFSIIIRVIATLIVGFLLYLLLREKITVTRISSAIATIAALAVLWLADIEGATRLVFLGLEIDKRVESAEMILKRLKSVENEAKTTTDDLQKVRDEANNIKTELSALSEEEQKKFEIQQLEKSAIDGSREAYRSLKNYKSENVELRERAALAELSVKRFYIGTSRIKARTLYKLHEGEKIEDENLKTSWLIDFAKSDPRWDTRACAVKILRNRKEKGVPEVLLEVMKNDQNLWVCKEALDSFERVTGYQASDIFQFETEFPITWYNKNKEEVKEKLKEPEQ